MGKETKKTWAELMIIGIKMVADMNGAFTDEDRIKQKMSLLDEKRKESEAKLEVLKDQLKICQEQKAAEMEKRRKEEQERRENYLDPFGGG